MLILCLFSKITISLQAHLFDSKILPIAVSKRYTVDVLNHIKSECTKYKVNMGWEVGGGGGGCWISTSSIRSLVNLKKFDFYVQLAFCYHINLSQFHLLGLLGILFVGSKGQRSVGQARTFMIP